MPAGSQGARAPVAGPVVLPARMHGECLDAAALYELRDRALTDVYASMLEPRNIETDREFNVRLKNLLMLIDRTTMSDGPGGGGGGTQLPSVFDRLEMKTSNMSGTLFQLPQPESDAEKNSG